MKNKRFIVMLAVALALCLIFGAVLGIFLAPMDDSVYNLSLFWEGETPPDDWVYDQKGWTVFVQEKEDIRELEPNGMGSFSSLDYPEQTFYMSRVMEETLESPTLRLETASRTFSVFLDGTLVYTDCPELDNRIGYLNLPCLDYYREEPLLVPLPLDYAGKTLTIAQSTDPETETDLEVTPCAITLYCGYTYESGLISESFRTAIPSVLAFAAGAALLALALWQAARGKLDATLIFGAMAAFLYEGSQMFGPSFFYTYYNTSPIDMTILCRELALVNLIALLSYKLTERRRIPLFFVLSSMTAAVFLDVALKPMGYSGSFFQDTAFCLLGIVGLLTALGLGFWELKNGSRFLRVFCPVAAGTTVLIGVSSLVYAIISGNLRTGPILQLELGAYGYFLWPLMSIFMATSFLGVVVELIQDEITARTEAKLLAQQDKMSRQSYETMRRQNQDVMLLRHDMAKHYQILRQMTKEPQIAEYLDELIGENKKIRPVTQSGNEILDIILNSKLSEAVSHGIAIETLRTRAPESLPLSDAELCSLVMNIMDNAIEAASAPEVERGYIKLDLHVENSFFVFTCENSSTLEWAQKETASGRGFGRSVIQRIMQRYGNLLNTEYGDGYYKVSVLLPLHRPLK